MASDSEVTLQTLFGNALRDASEALSRSTLQDETQVLISSSLAGLDAVRRGIEISGVFSPNEVLDDLSTSLIPYLALDYIVAELIGKLRTTNREERMRHIADSLRHLHAFIERIYQYDVVSKRDQKVYSTKLNDLKDPSKRRELKIQQFKAEKEVKNRLEALFNRKPPSVSLDKEWDIIQFMLAPSNVSPEGADEADEEVLRETYLLVIRLFWMRSQTQLENLDNELELLRTAPPAPPAPSQSKTTEDDVWRLDPIVTRGSHDGQGPLIDSSGRPLRPFTILPGNVSSERARFQAQVFRPDHRLPTMTVDEYLEKERQNGNIISGGGPQSLNAPTKAEQLTVASEMDGTLEGEMKAEEKRQSDENWAEYTDYHRKGEGNTMNRG